MKYTLLVFALIASFCVNAQKKLSVTESAELRKNAQESSISGKLQLINFILQQDTSLYNKGYQAHKNALADYQKLMDQGTMGSKTETSLIKTIIFGLKGDLNVYGSKFYDKIMKEKSEDRDKTFEFGGNTYKVSKSSKEDIDRLKNAIKTERETNQILNN